MKEEEENYTFLWFIVMPKNDQIGTGIMKFGIKINFLAAQVTNLLL